MTETLRVDDLAFLVTRSARRKTVELVVERDASLRLIAPPEATHAWMETYIRKKRFWVYLKLAEKESLKRPVVAKQYVSGEGFAYLGRRYRLLLVNEQDQPLKILSGRFRLRRKDAKLGREHFVRWYTEHAHRWLKDRVPAWARRLGVEVGRLDVRDLGYRWGSCGRNGAVYFHWAVMQSPPSIIDYVIVHELAHLSERHHTPEFWRRVERAMPDFAQRRERLSTIGAAPPL